jgi:V8-like Glu-specific endopeptidase
VRAFAATPLAQNPDETMHPRLVFTSGSRDGTDYRLTEGQTTVGRSPDCALQFHATDDVVSSHHATITLQGNRVWLRDENSLNGTFVDGQRIVEVELHHGQTVSFGRQGPTARIEMPGARPRQNVGATIWEGESQDASMPELSSLTSPDSSALFSAPPVPARHPRTPARAAPDTGLTGLFQEARAQAAAAAPTGRASQTAIVKAFVKLAQQRSSRRFRLLLGAVVVLGAAAVALVFFSSRQQQASLAGELVSVRGELETERAQRGLLEQQLTAVRSEAQVWESQSESLRTQVAATRQALSTSEGELRRQANEVARERTEAEQNRRFGSLITERYAKGMALLHFVLMYVAPDGRALRFTGTPQGDWAYTTDSVGAVPVIMNAFCTAFLIHPDGWLLTARHCVETLADTMRIRDPTGGVATFVLRGVATRAIFPPGDQVIEARPSSYSQNADIGLFKLVHPPSGLPVIPISRGHQIAVLGYPTGFENIMWRSGSHSQEMTDAQQAAFGSAVVRGHLEGWVKRVSSWQSGQLQPTEEETEGWRELENNLKEYATLGGVQKAEELRIVQPHLSTGTITDTTATDVFHDADTFGGTSGAPIFLGSALSVIAVHTSGYGVFNEARGKGFTKNSGVPVSFVWRFLPPDIATGVAAK